MILESLRTIVAREEARGAKPLPVHEFPELAIFVNSYWMNLCGSLDNLAWVLQHEYSLLPDTDEVGPNRRHVTLFSKKLQKALEARAAKCADTLRGLGTWHKELRELRDPAAHRIPLYPIPGVLTEEAARRVSELHAEADRHMVEGATSDGLALWHSAYNMGVYMPLLSVSRTEGHETHHLLDVTLRDGHKFADASESVVKVLLSS